MAKSRLKKAQPMEPRFMKGLIFGYDVGFDGHAVLTVLRACSTEGGVITVVEHVVSTDAAKA